MAVISRTVLINSRPMRVYNISDSEQPTAAPVPNA